MRIVTTSGYNCHFIFYGYEYQRVLSILWHLIHAFMPAIIMKHPTQLITLLLVLLWACNEKPTISSINPENWEQRSLQTSLSDSLETGQSYLSVYSQIYSRTEHTQHDLTATISMRNANTQDSIYLLKAQYFDTHGKLIRTYFEKPIFLGPMETVEIVINEFDREGGTGANFLFDWKITPGLAQPIFEGVMISTSGQQGLSFTTQGKRIQ